MASSPNWPPALPERLGRLREVSPLGPSVRRAVTESGLEVVVKGGDSVADEARGLQRLAAVEDGPRVPAVVHHDDDWLVMEWIEPGRTPDPVALGGALAGLHSAPAGGWGGGSSWIGACPVSPAAHDTAAGFYGARLVELAGRCGLEGVVEPVAGRLADLVPAGPPSVLHGDLWWGNVIWAADGRPAVIDPSVHHGHAEEDLAMLALFGTVPPSLLGAYQERRPLDDGWADRVQLWQLVPLLVHTVLFGGGYRRQAIDAARRYT